MASSLLLMCFGLTGLGAGAAHAYDGGGSAVVGSGGARDWENERTRATWAAMLGGYVALGALTTGAAYLWRDNYLGRSIAVTAAGWGGLGLGAGIGYGLAHLHGCASADCAGEEGVATAVGGALGSIVGSIAGHLLTRNEGMSRPYTAAGGMIPALLFFTIGTIIDW